MKKRLFMLLLTVACAIAGAQALTVRGTVVDQVNEPVIGATVKVLGTTMGAVTDFDGNFEIANVPDGAILRVSLYVPGSRPTLGVTVKVALPSAGMLTPAAPLTVKPTRELPMSPGRVMDVSSLLVTVMACGACSP